MTLLIKMQSTLVTFSLTLMFKVRVFFIFLRRWINSNLLELIHVDKNMKRNERFNALFFENSLPVHTKEYCKYNMCALRVLLIFRNILPCKPPLNLDGGLLATYYLFKYFFSPRFLWVADIVHAQNCFLYLLT